jgi:hypothetical protein
MGALGTAPLLKSLPVDDVLPQGACAVPLGLAGGAGWAAAYLERLGHSPDLIV